MAKGKNQLVKSGNLIIFGLLIGGILVLMDAGYRFGTDDSIHGIISAVIGVGFLYMAFRNSRKYIRRKSFSMAVVVGNIPDYPQFRKPIKILSMLFGLAFLGLAIHYLTTNLIAVLFYGMLGLIFLVIQIIATSKSPDSKPEKPGSPQV
jgi:hypothetical protein